MAFRRTKRAGPSRADLLSAVPRPNPAVVEQRLDRGTLRLSISLPKRPLVRWLTGGGDEIVRRFELDDLGTQVWRMIDGRTTVRDLIERFASLHQLNLREAEVSMLAYLRTLAERGIMLLAFPGRPSDDHPA